MARHLRYILDGIGITQTGSNAMYEDKAATILMENADKPMERSRNIDIQYFAFQEWIAKELVKLFHIHGVANPEDSMTKGLRWVLHTRHITRMMEHCETSYTTTSGCIELG